MDSPEDLARLTRVEHRLAEPLAPRPFDTGHYPYQTEMSEPDRAIFRRTAKAARAV